MDAPISVTSAHDEQAGSPTEETELSTAEVTVVPITSESEEEQVEEEEEEEDLNKDVIQVGVDPSASEANRHPPKSQRW